jgi:hypothetical protein
MLALFCATIGLYAGGFDHDFHLDSVPGIVENSHYSSLSNIPLYFRDPLSLTTVRANGDYRPVLQVTFALNYWISGHAMWSWHLVQVLLHVICVLSVFILCRRILWGLPGERSPLFNLWVPFFGALIFALHPTASGVVNYIWARSSLLVAALLLPAFLLYMGHPGSKPQSGPCWGALILYTLALFTKIEAVAALAVFFFWEVIRFNSRNMVKDFLSAWNWRTLVRLLPFIIVTLFYFAVREMVLPKFLSETRQNAETTSLNYLATQLVACWYYLGQWVLPIHLIADDQSFPQYESFLELPVVGAIAGWIAVGVLLVRTYRQRPEYVFLALSAWALISPTSSVLPLAEMVNEHRAYLPRAIVWPAVWIPLVGLFGRISAPRTALRRVGIGALVLVLLALTWSTWKRNAVFATDESYWHDVYAKTGSPRSSLNLGIVLMKKGQLDQARALFEESLSKAPAWHYTLINLGIVNAALGHHRDAQNYFDQAVRYDAYDMVARFHRGEYYLKRKEYAAARDDLEACLGQLHRQLKIHLGLAEAYAGLGDVDASLKHTRAAFKLDPKRTELSIVRISTPYWETPSQYELGIEYYLAVAEILPGRPWIKENIRRLGYLMQKTQRAACLHRYDG